MIFFQTSPVASEKMEVSMTTSLESGPPSDQSTVVDKGEIGDSRQDPLDTSSSSDQFNTSDLKVRYIVRKGNCYQCHLS